MAEYKALDAKVVKLSKRVLEMCASAGSGHPSSGLSLVHMTTALMYRVMKYDPKNPWNNAADRLVLSEGHAVPILYAALCDLGAVAGTTAEPHELTWDEALTLREASSVLDGHPNPARGMPFFDAATGSLGQGLSVAAGVAAAGKLDGLDKKVFCMIGDGESREGQIWEAMDFIVDHELTNVFPIFNCNGQGQSDYVSGQQTAETLAKKCEAYNFEVRTIDGHNWDEIFEAFTREAGDKPVAIIANTVKGWGVQELQRSNYHGKPLSEDQLEEAFADLDKVASDAGVTEADGEDAFQCQAPAAGSPEQDGPISAGDFAEAAAAAGMGDAVEKGKLSTRKAYGVALQAIGADQRVVATDGDVKNSTYAQNFFDTYPDRFFEARIAEQNMVSAAAGMAAGNKIPFVSTFGKFFVRAYDQVEMAAISEANIKLTGSHTGVSLAADGPSQMALPDLAFFRAFARSKRVDGNPACNVMLPSDAVSAFKLTELMANIDGMCYMRTHRPDVPIIYDADEEFELGGFKHLIDGEDLCIVASGYMVHEAKKACDILEEKAGLSASLIDAYSMPLNTEEILQIGDDCRGQILVVEDNYVGGIAAELTAAAAESDLGVMVSRLHVDAVPKSGKSPEEILAMVGLTAADIANAAQNLFDRSEA